MPRRGSLVDAIADQQVSSAGRLMSASWPARPVPPARATVRQVSGFDATRAERNDGVLHHELSAPSDRPPAPIEPAPAPPTEQELRKHLVAKIEVSRTANAALAEAMAASEHGQRHCDNLRLRIVECGDVDDEIVQFTVTSLRIRGNAVLPAELANRRAARDLARTDLAAAESALAVLDGELTEAKAGAAEAQKIAQAAAATRRPISPVPARNGTSPHLPTAPATRWSASSRRQGQA